MTTTTMKIACTSSLIAACVFSTAASGQALHPADRYDIKSEAEFAVQKVAIKAGEPTAGQGGYIVPVTVAHEKCTVTVRPYTPKSDMEPPRRWKAEPPVCRK
ncbi:hypothetical protein K6L09_41655 [Burkholderia cepacia]|uniref:hypothetical protein n=1 Tax=Burkholderia vietnamiensis TaxID=60552 RepID=UPI001B91A12C|nr:hypothetical protein [Burkholderia vietnamiensis]MBR8085614.1 hypothetical protein [Burkholderia vietnamiensis]